MKRNPGSLAAVIIYLLFIALVQTSCRENTLFNAKLDPNHGNGLTYDTTFHAITSVIQDDSINTSASFPGLPVYHGLGYISSNANAYFGGMISGVYMQVVPEILNFNFSVTNTAPGIGQYQIDSAVLILPFTTGGSIIWGDTTNPAATQGYTVYLANSSLSLDSTYYGFTTVPLGTQISATTTVNINGLKDSVIINGVTQSPHLRITLNQAFIHYADSILALNYVDNPTFLNTFKGIYIAPDTTVASAAAMPYFDLNDENGYGTEYSRGGILFYYSNSYLGIYDSVISFYFDPTYCAHFNSIVRKPSYHIASLVQTGGDGTMSILQDEPGSDIDVKIWGLRSLIQNGKVPVINMAELNIPIMPVPGFAYQDSLYYAPPKLYPLGYSDATGTLYQVADRYPITSTSPLQIIDGYQHVVNGVTQYQINIPREVQSTLVNYLATPSLGDTVHLHIIGTQDYLGAYQVVTGGGSYGSTPADSIYQIKLKVVYSKLK